jgi:hypothetical protein
MRQRAKGLQRVGDLHAHHARSWRMVFVAAGAARKSMERQVIAPMTRLAKRQA